MFPKAYNHITETKVTELSYTNTVQTEFTNWFCYVSPDLLRSHRAKQWMDKLAPFQSNLSGQSADTRWGKSK